MVTKIFWHHIFIVINYISHYPFKWKIEVECCDASNFGNLSIIGPFIKFVLLVTDTHTDTSTNKWIHKRSFHMKYLELDYKIQFQDKTA